jgi:hypothetical protein
MDSNFPLKKLKKCSEICNREHKRRPLYLYNHVSNNEIIMFISSQFTYIKKRTYEFAQVSICKRSITDLAKDLKRGVIVYLL